MQNAKQTGTRPLNAGWKSSVKSIAVPGYTASRLPCTGAAPMSVAMAASRLPQHHKLRGARVAHTDRVWLHAILTRACAHWMINS